MKTLCCNLDRWLHAVKTGSTYLFLKYLNSKKYIIEKYIDAFTHRF